jgi:hypothetical protein
MTCPSCKVELPKETRLCPHCGALVYAGLAQQQRQINGDYSATGQLMPPILPYITKSKWGDIALGVLVGSVGGYGSIIGIPIAFFLLRKKYPVFTNTIGIVWILGVLAFIASFFQRGLPPP